MWLKLLGDPALRRAYVATKAGVVGAAAVATVFVARVVGPKAWNGFFVFAGVLAVLTVAVLVASRASEEACATEAGTEDDESEEPEPPGPVVLPIEDSIDLHPFAPKEIPDVVGGYIEAAHQRGLREVRLIHGRGIGVQRERVRSLLERHPLVRTFHDAPPQGGGWGATVAHLEEPGVEQSDR